MVKFGFAILSQAHLRGARLPCQRRLPSRPMADLRDLSGPPRLVEVGPHQVASQRFAGGLLSGLQGVQNRAKARSFRSSNETRTSPM